MNKPELIVAIQNSTGASKATISDILDAQASVAAATLAQGETVIISGIAKLTPKDRPARMGRNPSTGATVEIPAKRVVTAKVLKA